MVGRLRLDNAVGMCFMVRSETGAMYARSNMLSCACVRVCVRAHALHAQGIVAVSASVSAYSHDPRKSMAEPPALMAGPSIALMALVQVCA
jgi:hypothetical protein